jgi:guanine deaminase
MEERRDISAPDERWMKEAVELAVQNARSGKGGPFAALVVRNGVVLARGTNLVTSSNDPTAHAEIVAIRMACSALGGFQLDGCDVYTSCEPCPMCLGALYWARPARIFFSASRYDAAAAGFDDSSIYQELSLPFEHRRIPLIQILSPLGTEPFEAWKEFETKVRY